MNDYPIYHKVPSAHGAHPVFREERTIFDMSGRTGADYVGFRVTMDKRLLVVGKNGKTRPLLIAGVSGSIRYNNGLCQFTEAQMRRKLLFLAPRLLWNKIRYGTYLDIFLTHASPRHIHDREDPCHIGFECFNTFIKKSFRWWMYFLP